jgi:multiple sugar transport system permease protein
MHEERTFKILRVIGLAFFTLITLFPLYTVVISSIKPLADVRSAFRWVPSRITFTPYADIWSTIPLARYFLNSLLISLGATVISVFVAILAAYAISRYRFSGRGVFSLIVLSTQMFPGILFLLPLFVIYVNLERVLGIQLYGSYAGLIITYLTFALPFSIWMLVGYFVPVSMPGIVAVAIFAFITAWGEVLFASVLTDDATRTLAVGLRNYAIQSNVYWNQLMAAAIVVSIPVVAGFLALQRYLVQGIAAGGVKG